MGPVIERLHKRAMRMSRRAVSMWLEAAAMIRNNSSPSSVQGAMELNRRAIEECQQAINTIDFIERYRDEDEE